jgi:hypothetical protein
MNGLTPLEAIAQKLEEKRQGELESILKISGSSAIARNEYGITVVNENNVASSLAFKKLIRPKYDETELKKAIDIEVRELRPDIPIPNLDLVPKPLYDDEVATNDDLRKQVSDLTLEVGTLTSTITDLESQVQSEINNRLSIEQSNDALVNQLNTLTQTVDDFALQIQNSLQKSVEEGILRASLQSQNTGFKAQIQALIKQIDSLNSIIEGLQSQLGAVQNQQAIVQGTQAQAMAAGADVINDVVIAKVARPDVDQQYKEKFYGRLHAKNGSKWINGESIDFTNNDKQPVTITITTTATQGVQWFSPAESSFELAAGAQKTLNMRINEQAAKGVDSKGPNGWFRTYSNSKLYTGGSLKISVKRSDGTSKDKSYDACFDKMHPKSY